MSGSSGGAGAAVTDLAASPLRPTRAVLTAGATGFGVMAAELTAVRLLAPHFGDSAYVWTNVIGVILAAMALGAALGGRLSGRPTGALWPFRLLLVAGVLLLLAPFAARWLGGMLLPADLPLDVAMPALIRGSLVATAVVFAPPLLLLSAVSPLLIVWLARNGVPLGRAAGDVAAAGTVGSLIGTFAATHWLVPGFGCRIALAIAAGVLLLAALLVAPRAGRVVAVGGLLAGGLLSLLHGGPLRPPPVGTTLLAERETPYQFLQVQRTEGGGQPAQTKLVINEGLDSFHSLAIDGSAFTGGAYYDWHAVAPLLAGDGKRPAGLRALSVGDAAGTLREVYAAVHSTAIVDAVDIDPVTMALGDEFFAATKAEGARYALDGRVFLQRSSERWHVIHVDAYAHQVYVPAHLASVEFFAAARERLLEGGVLACNVGALDRDDPVLVAIAATVRKVFGQAWVFMVPNSRNALLLARRGVPLQPTDLGGSDPDTTALSAADQQHWRDLLSTCQEPERWHDLTADEPILTDDWPVLDELLFDSYVADADPREATACVGQRDVAGAELDAYEAIRQGQWLAVLKITAASRAPSAYLRQLAGDARWRLRHLHSAVAEYRDGLQHDPDEATRVALEQRLRGAEQELRPIADAEAAASRNGWLALLVAATGLAMTVALRRA